jgi:endonuclease G
MGWKSCASIRSARVMPAHRAWAHWQLNDNATRGAKPISYAELVRRTGIDFLPGVNLRD